MTVFSIYDETGHGTPVFLRVCRDAGCTKPTYFFREETPDGSEYLGVQHGENREDYETFDDSEIEWVYDQHAIRQRAVGSLHPVTNWLAELHVADRRVRDAAKGSKR